MDGLFARLTAAGLSICLMLAAPLWGAPAEPKPLPSAYDDAELRAVAFVDAQQGWAVGDHGVILHTGDGGRSWEPQSSGVDCRLETVCFLDADNGWAAGGDERPYLSAPKGVLLRTFDGGRTWENDTNLVLSTIKKVCFHSAAQGWIVAVPSAVFPSGLLCTDDGGQTWMPLASQQFAVWAVADFADAITGAVAGRSGMRGNVRERTLDPWQQTDGGLREPQALALATTKDGWLVGDGGLLLSTRDGGQSWRVPTETPEGNEHFDWQAVAARGTHCWIAGSPGTRVMHSADQGATWQSCQTGQSLPLHALTFVDGQHGWAVGSLGTILATADGGRTWKKQCGKRQRAAIVALFGEARDVPLEAVARLAANEGYVTAIELLVRRDVEPDTADSARQRDRNRVALESIGASSVETAWAFPLRQVGLQQTAQQITDGWNRVHNAHAIEQLEAHLVRCLRTWRPDVVLTSPATTDSENPLAHLVNQAVLSAVAQAGDSARHAEQLSTAGLEPWTVKKVFGSLPPGRLGTVNVNTSQLAPRLTQSLGDHCAPARGLLDENPAAPPASWGFRLFIDSSPQGVGERDFFSGLTLQPGGNARRELPEVTRPGMDVMRQVAQRHRNLQAILKKSEQTSGGQALIVGQLAELTRGLDGATAAEALFELAHAYHAGGQWERAATVFQLLTEKYPNHALTTPALVWLVQYWSSGEAACRAGRDALPNLAVAADTVTRAGAEIPAASVAARAVVPEALRGERSGRSETEDTRAARCSRATEFGKALEKRDAHAGADFQVLFPLALVRQSDPTRPPADRGSILTALAQTRPHDAWWECARGEQWLNGGAKGAPPKTRLVAKRAASKPRLDALLEDEVWQAADRHDLRSALGDDRDWPAVVMLSYDDEYLYIALDCRCAPGLDYPPEIRTRTRDADLAAFDRVELFLDVDRDWTTFYRLAVDCRGWTAEDCWNDTTWNPQWFVAAGHGEQSWTIEAAIPLAQLSATPIAPQTVWALGLQRTIPGFGFQSWTRPATVARCPQGCGYLIFE